MALRSLTLLAQLAAVTLALNAGDCAFVGIYGDQDDFAVVLLEDVGGDQLFVGEGLDNFKASNWFKAKDAVQDARRGTVLRKKDFESATLLAPAGLSLFKGSANSPEVLCRIKLDEGLESRHLSDTVVLGEVESAEYGGRLLGTKDELLASIGEVENWVMGVRTRKLRGFTVASANTTMMMTSTTEAPNTTMGMTTTTMMETTAAATTSTAAPFATVAGCIGTTFTDASAVLEDASVKAALKTSISGLVTGVSADMITELTLALGTCSNRRLTERFLQTAGEVTISYVISFPPTMMDVDAVAQMSQTELAALTPAQVQTAIETEFTTQNIAYTVTVVTVSAPTVVITNPTTTTLGGGDSGACGSSLALGALLLLSRMI